VIPKGETAFRQSKRQQSRVISQEKFSRLFVVN
jgi:hypothetical protein